MGAARPMIFTGAVACSSVCTSLLQPVISPAGTPVSSGRARDNLSDTADGTRRISDNVVFLYEGMLIQKGPTENLFTNPCEEEIRSFICGIFG